MFHHYSWVRTRDEMMKKVQSWGHKNDRDWVALVNEEFSAPFKGSDFVHGYKYKTVSPLFDIRFETAAFKPREKEPRVIRLSQKDLLDQLKFKKSILFDWILGLIK
jgi:hypothetical protein